MTTTTETYYLTGEMAVLYAARTGVALHALDDDNRAQPITAEAAKDLIAARSGETVLAPLTAIDARATWTTSPTSRYCECIVCGGSGLIEAAYEVHAHGRSLRVPEASCETCDGRGRLAVECF